MTTKAALPRGMRRLTIRGETWGWRFGDPLRIRQPDGTQHQVPLTEFLGEDAYEISRSREERNLAISPSDLVAHINRKILGYDDAKGFPPRVLPQTWRAGVREGWRSVQGPRGLWTWNHDAWVIRLHSPEDVVCEVRIHVVLGIELNAWADILVASMKAAGTSVDERRRAGRGVDALFDWDAPDLPKVTDAHMLAYIEHGLIGGRTRVAA